MKVFVHEEIDRHCILGPDDIWRHWDNDGKVVGPRDAIDWRCRMDHPLSGIQMAKLVMPGEPSVSEVVNPSGMTTLGRAARGLLFDEGKEWDLNAAGLKAMVCKITESGVSVDYGDDVGQDAVAVTDDARYILNILPDILIKFLQKNAQYKDAQVMNLGAKGIVPDLNRKTAAIKARVWDEIEVQGDTAEELLGDVIGHALLMLAQLRHT